MKRFLIAGSGGRESAFAYSLKKDTELYAVMDHANPTIIDCVNESGGKYLIGNASNPKEVAHFAGLHHIDYAFVSADAPLANGVVDALLEKNIKAIGGTKAAARIEWDKIYSIEMVKALCPEHTPFFKVVSNEEELISAIEAFKAKHLPVVVKPQGLTGGKGVKVMPEHLRDYNQAIDYATLLLRSKPEEKVLLVEKLTGIEFTIMGITDGQNMVLSPASYDYPFRLEDDKGPGTGGMGCFTDATKKLPFMDGSDLDSCRTIMQRVIDKMSAEDLFFNGVLNGGFFKTKDGIKFMEFNGRFGDPEGLNILSVLKGSFAELLEDIWNRKLSDDSIKFMEKASVVKYLVAKEYPMESEQAIEFTIDEEAIRKLGVTIFHASCIKSEKGHYVTLKKSRVVAFGAVSDKIVDASSLINLAIDKHVNGNLEYRKDIGSAKSIARLEGGD